jgi:hypothetical protein
VEELIKQRVYAIALGYEDLNDHDRLRHDVVMGLLCEKSDPSGSDRVRERDQGKAIAGKSTLNRLELTPEGANENSRYKKIVAQGEQIEAVMVEICIESQVETPVEVVLDVDATDDPLYGKQEGRFFHGYYSEYCYLPLYIFWGGISAVCTVASGERRPGQWSGPGAGADRQEVASGVAGGENHRAWGLRLLPRGDHEVLRAKRENGLCVGAGQEQPSQ